MLNENNKYNLFYRRSEIIDSSLSKTELTNPTIKEKVPQATTCPNIAIIFSASETGNISP